MTEIKSMTKIETEKAKAIIEIQDTKYMKKDLEKNQDMRIEK